MSKKDTWIIDHCKEQVGSSVQWGKYAREHLGDKIYEMALNAELLLMVDKQDESTDPATIVKIMREGRRQIIEEMNP